MVGQQLAVTPIQSDIFYWELAYNSGVITLVEGVNSIEEEEVEWLREATQVGTTRLTLTSEPPPCDQNTGNCTTLPSMFLTLEVRVVSK